MPLEHDEFTEKLSEAFELAQQEAWEHEIPKTSMRLKLLLRLLSNLFPDFWNQEAGFIARALLNENLDMAVKLNEFDPLTMGFAMRTHRIVSRDFSKQPTSKAGTA